MSRIIYLLGFCLIVAIAHGKTLRGAVDFLKNSIRKSQVKEMFLTVYYKTINHIAQNAPSHKFTMYCTPQLSIQSMSNCVDGYNLWKTTNYYTDIVLYNISTQQIESDVMARIANVFPDANIKVYNKNCCNYYNISW